MNKDKIVCLVGSSGSGKTTLAKELEKLGYNIIFSYTTREPREKEEWGHTFIDKSEFKSDAFKICKDLQITPCYNASRIIANFNDYEKDEVYFATKEQYQGKGTSIYIVDPEGAKMVKENVKDAEVITIFLMADETTKLGRLKKRHKESKNKDEGFITNVVNRIIRDREIFKTCKCDYVVDANREVEEVLKDLVEIIC